MMTVCMLTDEALVDACQWLIAAGFPQYVQLLLGKPASIYIHLYSPRQIT